MIVSKLEDYTRGWVIGDFLPSVLRTKGFEVGVLKHYKDEKWSAHYHSVSTEYNILIEGSMNVCGKELIKGDVFIIEQNEVADPTFHEDCTIVCIKVPSAIGDKHLV